MFRMGSGVTNRLVLPVGILAKPSQASGGSQPAALLSTDPTDGKPTGSHARRWGKSTPRP
jgi:hypothetical protein